MRISQPEFITGLVVFALDRKNRTASIEAEHCIGQIQPCNYELKSVIDAVTRLRIHLSMLIEINIAERPMLAKRYQVGVGVAPNVRAVVGDTKSSRKTPAIVGRAEVESVWCLALQIRQIGSERNPYRARGCKSVIRRYSNPAERSGQK